MAKIAKHRTHSVHAPKHMTGGTGNRRIHRWQILDTGHRWTCSTP